jgi:hypothetical protein
MTFKENIIYLDRSGLQYTYSHKSGGVTVFRDRSGFLKCRNHEGMYRWDGKETNEDIIGETK